MRIFKVLPVILALFFLQPSASADWVWSPEQGKFINTQEETQTDASDLFDEALELYKEKKLDKAAEQFQLILKKFPKSNVAPESQYRLGTIYEETGDYVKAHKAYEALIKSYPQSERFDEVIEREYQIGMTFLSGKKGKLLGLEIRSSVPLAVEVFQKIVEVAPYSTFGDKSQFNIGVAYQKSGQYDQAIEAFQNLLDQYPKSDLVQQARLNMTEASYSKSVAQTRDQSALDMASQQAQGYLQRYPESEDAKKATAIRQKVDELNAEKNYRIGLYYEKDNYLESALIYYRDTAKRYPETTWGKKAADKLSSLEEPVKYLNSRADALYGELRDLEAKYQALGKDQKQERAQVKAEIEKLKKRIKLIDKNKVESLSRRKQDLKRREQELKEKFKELERKKKRYKNNTSEDFLKAIARWQASLEAERDALAEERAKLETWRSELGIPDEHFYENLIPFRMRQETPLEKIQRMDEKALYKISRKKKEIFEKKEKLYKRYSELQVLLTPQRTETGVIKKRLRGMDKRDPSKPVDPKLEAREQQILAMEAKLDEKKAAYEKHFGKMAEMELEAMLEKRFATAGSVNPLGASEQDLKDKGLEELLVLKMHLTEKITTQQTIVQTLSTAFDKELAMREQQQMMATLEQTKDEDGRKLRKQIKSVEKDIRGRYQDIQDRHKRKTELLAELDEALHPQESHTALKTVAKPVTGTFYLAKAFLFGLPNEDVELTQEASKSPVSSDRAKKLQEEIELESLMVEAQDLEIAKLEKELEILHAKASLAGGMKFRSSLVKVPYAFIEEAIESARRVVPKMNRADVLLNRLDRQTKELDILKQKLAATEALIAEKTPAPVPAAAGAETEGSKQEAAMSASDEKSLREEIVQMQEQLEVAYSIYAQEQGIVLGEAVPSEAPRDAAGAKQYKEFTEVKGDLLKLIEEETGIEAQEKEILEKRVKEAEKVLPTITSKAMYQDVVTEKERILQRLEDLETRRDFLSNEKERFSSKA